MTVVTFLSTRANRGPWSSSCLLGSAGRGVKEGGHQRSAARGGGCRSDHEVTGELAGTLAVPSAPFKHTYLAGNIRAAVSQSGNSAEDGGAEGGESE